MPYFSSLVKDTLVQDMLTFQQIALWQSPCWCKSKAAKEKLWKISRKAWRTTDWFKNRGQCAWKQNIKKQGVVQDFCKVMYYIITEWLPTLDCKHLTLQASQLWLSRTPKEEGGLRKTTNSLTAYPKSCRAKLMENTSTPSKASTTEQVNVIP